jgi:hypothetical protein
MLSWMGMVWSYTQCGGSSSALALLKTSANSRYSSGINESAFSFSSITSAINNLHTMDPSCRAAILNA